MTQPIRIYLAGPEVFFPTGEHQAIVAEKKRLLQEYGLEGVDPLDTELALFLQCVRALTSRGGR